MFGGIARREVRLAMGLALAFVGGGICANWLRDPRPILAESSLPVESKPRHIGRPPAQPERAADNVQAIDGQIDLNEATAAQLAELPSIGPTKAEAILEYRDRVGGFAAIDELDAVSGIGRKTVDQLRPFLIIAHPAERNAAPAGAETIPTKGATPLATPVPAVVRLNTGGRDELMTLSGVGEKLADRIIADRIIRGRFRTVEDLARVRGIGPAIIERNRQRMVLD